jgi:hypothetical protein
LRRAAWVFLLPAWLGLSAALSRCAGLAASNAEMPVTGPDPSYRTVVMTHLKQVLKNYSVYNTFEISDPRWVHSIKGWTWLTCVRFRDQDREYSYALFLDGNRIVDDRFAVQIDRLADIPPLRAVAPCLQRNFSSEVAALDTEASPVGSFKLRTFRIG